MKLFRRPRPKPDLARLADAAEGIAHNTRVTNSYLGNIQAALLKLVTQRERKARFAYSVQVVTKEESRLMELTCTNEQKVRITLSPVTDTGRPAEIEAGKTVVSVVSGESTVTMIDDKTFEVVSSDAPGDTTYLVECDADISPEGTETIQDTITLHVQGARARNLGMTADAPVAK